MSPRAWTALRWTIGIAVVALLIVGLDGTEILSRIRSANAPLVVLAVLGLTAVHAIGAGAWRVLCRQLGGLRLGWVAGLRLYYAAQALGGVTPANIGGDAYRVLAVRNAGLGWGAAVAPVLVQRATSYLSLALLALPALAYLVVSSDVPVAILAAGSLLSGLAVAVALLLLFAPARVTAIRAFVPWPRPNPETRPRDASAWSRPPMRSVVEATAFGVAFHALSVLLTAVLVAAVDPSAVGPAVLAAIVVARLSLAVPILPSGLGANEALLSLVFIGLGLAPETALAGLLLGRLALVLTTLLGAAMLLVGQPVIGPATARALPIRA